MPRGSNVRCRPAGVAEQAERVVEPEAEVELPARARGGRPCSWGPVKGSGRTRWRARASSRSRSLTLSKTSPSSAVLEVAQAAVDQLRRLREVPAPKSSFSTRATLRPAQGRVARDARAGDAAADDEEVELLGGQGRRRSSRGRGAGTSASGDGPGARRIRELTPECNDEAPAWQRNPMRRVKRPTTRARVSGGRCGGPVPGHRAGAPGLRPPCHRYREWPPGGPSALSARASRGRRKARHGGWSRNERAFHPACRPRWGTRAHPPSRPVTRPVAALQGWHRELGGRRSPPPAATLSSTPTTDETSHSWACGSWRTDWSWRRCCTRWWAMPARAASTCTRAAQATRPMCTGMARRRIRTDRTRRTARSGWLASPARTARPRRTGLSEPRGRATSTPRRTYRGSSRDMGLTGTST